MKHTTSFAYLLCTCIILFSCNKEDNDPKGSSTTTEFAFTYKNITYSSICEEYEDGSIYINDPEVRELYDLLSLNPLTSTLIDENDNIFYYDSWEELKTTYEMEEIICEDDPLTRCPGWNCYDELHLYENTDFKKFMEVLNNGIIQKKDKLSSFAFIVGNVTYDPNLYVFVNLHNTIDQTGDNITFRSERGDRELKIANLKKYKLRPGSSKNWNDQAKRVKSYRSDR